MAGPEPVSLGRLEVEGVVVPMFSVGFDQGDGGAKVASVSAGSPAQRAGLEAGDVVTAIDSKRITKFAEAMSRVGMAKIGQDMKFEVRRDGQTKVIVIKPE